MASSETSYSATRLMVLVSLTKDAKGKELQSREIVESLVVSPKGAKGNALVAAKQLIDEYRANGWTVEVLDKKDPELGISVGRFYLRATRQLGSETIELYFTSYTGRDSSARCESCSATFDFAKKDFCPNCKKLTAASIPTVDLS